MNTIKAVNVNDAYPLGIMLLASAGVEQKSQHGTTLELPEPASICYLNPRERVLFDPVRDSNPFLSFFEALWIIAGRSDVKFLADLVPRMANYSDDGSLYYGAYGFRMRHSEHGDQIAQAVKRLKANPDDRQVVLTIRNSTDMWYHGRDTPCNLMVDCKVRSGKLNIHVFNRSNDFIWGMTGTNVVQFSTLQEYMAGLIGCKVGQYHQTTSSMHVYMNEQWDKVKDTGFSLDPYRDAPYRDGIVKPYDMMQGNHDDWHSDLRSFFVAFDDGNIGVPKMMFRTPYFRDVVSPMWQTFRMWKLYREDKSILNLAHVLGNAAAIGATDWQLAVMQWIKRRTNKESK